MTKSLTEATKSGNKYDALIALRDILSATIERCESGRDMASLSKRLIEVMDEIEQLEKLKQTKASPMAKRRASRSA